MDEILKHVGRSLIFVMFAILLLGSSDHWGVLFGAVLGFSFARTLRTQAQSGIDNGD